MPFQFITLGVERQGSRSPSTAGFGMDGGKASMKILVNEDKLDDSIKECLGSAVPDGQGGITRVLPLAHPQFPWLFCERISNIEGLHFLNKFANEGELLLEAEPLPFYAYYEKYELTLEFVPRPYAVLGDKNIGVDIITYFPEPEGAVLNPQETKFSIYREWLRFCDWDYIPAGDYLTAQQGQFVFKMNDAADPLREHAVGNGQLRLMQPNVTIKFRWHQVPFSYVQSANSNFRAGIGKINQHEWLEFGPGTLLFTGVTVMAKYTPPFPEWVDWKGADVPSQQKLCNLELTFIYKDYKIGKPYTKEDLKDSKNDVVGGQNLLPNAIDRKYYYAKTKGQALVQGMPVYPSYPFQLLFRDPNV